MLGFPVAKPGRMWYYVAGKLTRYKEATMYQQQKVNIPISDGGVTVKVIKGTG